MKRGGLRLVSPSASATDHHVTYASACALRWQSAFVGLLERKSGLEIRSSRIAKFKVRKAIAAAIRDLTVADVNPCKSLLRGAR